MPDVRLIDANALLKELRKIEVLSLDGKDLFTGPARIAVFGRIEEAPTITPPVRTGRWEYVDGDEYSETYRCKCGHEVGICIEIICEALPNYCPACGCDMRKKTERGSQQ